MTAAPLPAFDAAGRCLPPRRLRQGEVHRCRWTDHSPETIVDDRLSQASASPAAGHSCQASSGIQLGSPLVGTFAQSGERLRVEAPAQSLECPVRSSGRRWPTLGRRPPGQNHGPSSREFELPRPAVPHLQRVDINQAPSREPAEQSKHLVYGHLVRMQDPTRRQALPKAESERRGSSAATSTPEDVRTSTAQKVSWHG
jgi:hypothetical protein